MLENYNAPHRSRFIKIDNDKYIRQIKKRIFSSWKIVINRKTNCPWIFTQYEVDKYRKSGTFECAYTQDYKNSDKWIDFDLI